MEFVRLRGPDDAYSSVGLLWFSNDFNDICGIKGEVEFTDADVDSKKTVLPNGAHASYKSRRFTTPRGRVELNEGVPTISVGEDCPDSMVDFVISFMGLDAYRDIVRVVKGSFWNKK